MIKTLRNYVRIGDTVPGFEYFTIKPVVRIDGWRNGVEWLPLEPFNGSEFYIGTLDDSARVYPAWSTAPEYILPHNSAGYRPPVRVAVTGRTPTKNGGEYWLRGRVEFCRDGEPSEFAPCWILLD